MAALLAFFSGVLFFLIGEIRASKPLSENSSVYIGRGWWGFFWITFLLSDLLGLCLSFAGLFLLQVNRWLVAPVTVCFVITLLAAVILVAVNVGWFKWRMDRALVPQRHSWCRRSLKTAAALTAMAAVFSLGNLLGHGGSAQQVPSTLAAASPYRISGTCVNGSCFVNECKEPVPCSGKDPAGRLFEGTPVDIECQQRGEQANAPNGRGSYIWDRLASGVFISDLYVNTPRTDRFTKRLPRCSLWR
jgi:hypothetical protein